MSTSKPQRQAAIAFIYVTLVLDTMAGAIAYPVLPKLVGQMSHADAAQIAEIFGVFGTMFFVMQFFAAPIQGSLSDAYGRRPVILISSIGMALDYVVMALAPSIGWLYVGRTISGITAGSISAATAYLIDVTPVADRTRTSDLQVPRPASARHSVRHSAALPVPTICACPFWIAAVLSLLNTLYGWLVLPESLKAEHGRPVTWRNTNPVGAMTGVVRDYPALIWWALVIALYAVATMGVNSIYAVYVSYRYVWSPRDIGLYLSAVGVWAIVTQSLLLPVIIKRMSDRMSMIVGSILQALSIAGAGLAPGGIGYAVFALVWIVGLVVDGAATNTLLTQMIGPSDQGRVQGAARSLNSVVGLFAPGLFALLLASFIRLGGRPLSGVPYIISGIMVLIGLVVAMRITRPRAA